jgi:hypothetical protein
MNPFAERGDYAALRGAAGAPAVATEPEHGRARGGAGGHTFQGCPNHAA